MLPFSVSISTARISPGSLIPTKQKKKTRNWASTPEHPPVFDNRGEEMWNTCPAGDAVLAPKDSEGGGRDPFLRPRRKLSQGTGVVPEEDAPLVPWTDYHREKSQLLRDTRGECTVGVRAIFQGSIFVVFCALSFQTFTWNRFKIQRNCRASGTDKHFKFHLSSERSRGR